MHAETFVDCIMTYWLERKTVASWRTLAEADLVALINRASCQANATAMTYLEADAVEVPTVPASRGTMAFWPFNPDGVLILS
jgi:hypothetical protein